MDRQDWDDTWACILAVLGGVAGLVVGLLAIDHFLMDGAVLRDLIHVMWRW